MIALTFISQRHLLSDQRALKGHDHAFKQVWVSRHAAFNSRLQSGDLLRLLEGVKTGRFFGNIEEIYRYLMFYAQSAASGHMSERNKM